LLWQTNRKKEKRKKKKKKKTLQSHTLCMKEYLVHVQLIHPSIHPSTHPSMHVGTYAYLIALAFVSTKFPFLFPLGGNYLPTYPYLILASLHADRTDRILQSERASHKEVILVQSQFERHFGILEQSSAQSYQIGGPQDTALDTLALFFPDTTRCVSCEDHEGSHGTLCRVEIFVETPCQIVCFEDEKDDAWDFPK